MGARPARAILICSEDVTDAKAFAEYVAANAPTASNVRGSAAYRTHLMGVLVGRSIRKLMGDQSSTEVTEQTGAEAASHQ
jgi:CO/xanthine dehydrogenase FAD-binding subunit